MDGARGSELTLSLSIRMLKSRMCVAGRRETEGISLGSLEVMGLMSGEGMVWAIVWWVLEGEKWGEGEGFLTSPYPRVGVRVEDCQRDCIAD